MLVNRKIAAEILILNVLLLCLCSSCFNDHLINSPEIRKAVERRFHQRKFLWEDNYIDLPGIKGETISQSEREAMMFFYGSMPLSDIAEYSPRFFLNNIRMTLQSRTDYPWVASLTDEIFLHYVLPVRVNNENLDNFRINYYEEIHNIISGITDPETAALEINHWCHQKVAYKGADERTSSPEATILSARGRCGEESTFTVAALRTAGIPARQVYVPRWSHTDDNHAWVEVWINGSWHYMGACEPEPVLDHGWFTSPASRAMMVHTKSFGPYFGSERVVKNQETHAVLNLLDKYSKNRNINIIVTDSSGETVEGALVQFMVYNYAEFYPVASIYTGKNGTASLLTGRNDMLVWGSKDSAGGFVIIKEKGNINENIVIEKKSFKSSDFCINTEKADRNNPSVSEKESKLNRNRLFFEDSIRNAYINSWIDKCSISKIADEHNLNAEIVIPLIEKSMGNYSEIIAFLSNADSTRKDDAIALLTNISNKDLRDTKAEILKDHLVNSIFNPIEGYPRHIFDMYVANPGIEFEIIKPWRSFILNYFTSSALDDFKTDPSTAAEWIRENIVIYEQDNYYNVPLTPIASLSLKASDKKSADILFVAISRTCGVPARLSKATGIPEYYKDGKWNSQVIGRKDIQETDQKQKAKLYVFENESGDPEYYSDFTIANIIDGRPVTLEYEYNKKLKAGFNNTFLLDQGNYMLVNGQRRSNGSVIGKMYFFTLDGGHDTHIFLESLDTMNVFVQGEQFADILLYNNNGARDSVYLSEIKGTEGTIIAWIDRMREPSQHLLAELSSLKSEFEKWNGKIILITDHLMPDNEETVIQPSNLPGNTSFMVDPDFDKNIGSIFSTKDKSSILPYVVYVSPENRILYKSGGYAIGLGVNLYKLTIDQVN